MVSLYTRYTGPPTLLMSQANGRSHNPLYHPRGRHGPPQPHAQPRYGASPHLCHRLQAPEATLRPSREAPPCGAPSPSPGGPACREGPVQILHALPTARALSLPTAGALSAALSVALGIDIPGPSRQGPARAQRGHNLYSAGDGVHEVPLTLAWVTRGAPVWSMLHDDPCMPS